mmetsp:Transcript_8223/g.8928  ORF Transcript_8223/g.8928 Transcript_8223/m.8928 type:complete len:936 (-) Transcript_8223:201-3008(-)
MDHDTMSGNDFLGQLDINWSECYNNPAKWMINGEFKLGDPEKKCTDPTNPVKGIVYIQAKFLREDIDLDDMPQPSPHFSEPIPLKGKLKVHVICANGLRIGDDSSSDSFVKATMFGIKDSIKTDEIESLDPRWDHHQILDIDLPANTPPSNLICKVYDHDTLGSDEFLGLISIDWDDCVDNPGTWAVNKEFELTDPEKKAPSKNPVKGTLYVAMNWVPDGTIDDGSKPDDVCVDKNPPGKVQKRKSKKPDNVFRGKIKIRVFGAKGVKADEDGTSDPYCLCSISGQKGKFQTPTVSKRTNVIWDHKDELTVAVKKDATIGSLECKIYDDDTLSDDFLGKCYIDLQPTMDNPQKCVINDAFQLTSKDGKTDVEGEVYIQALFIPEEFTDTAGFMDNDPKLLAFEKAVKEGQAKKNSEMMAKKGKLKRAEEECDIQGVLKVRVVRGNNVRAADGSVSDPKCTLTIEPYAGKLETKKCKENLNPRFDFEGEFKFNIPSMSVLPKLKCLMVDVDWGGDDDLGGCEIDLVKSVENAGVCVVDGDIDLVDLTPNVKKDTPVSGTVYIQVIYFRKDQLGNAAIWPEPKEAIGMEEVAAKKTEGILKVRIVRANNLRGADDKGTSSDPSAVLKIDGLSGSIKGRKVKSNLNPVWNQEGEFKIVVPNVDKPPLMRCRVVDVDLGGDDYLGSCNINYSKCVKSPGKCCVNQEFVLENQEPKEKIDTPISGTIYIQAIFVTEASEAKSLSFPEPSPHKETTTTPEDKKEGVEESKKSPETTTTTKSEPKKPALPKSIKGVMKINLVRAKGLRIADSKTSDPKALVTIAKQKGKVEGKKKSKTLEPVWNQMGDIQINITDSSKMMPKLNVLIEDSDTFGNDYMGELNLSLVESVQKPGKCCINGFFGLEDLKPDSSKDTPVSGEVYIQAIFLSGEIAKSAVKFPAVK